MTSRKRAFLLILPPSPPSIAIPNIAEHYFFRHVLAMSLRHSASFGLALVATMAPLNDPPKDFPLGRNGNKAAMERTVKEGKSGEVGLLKDYWNVMRVLVPKSKNPLCLSYHP